MVIQRNIITQNIMFIIQIQKYLLVERIILYEKLVSMLLNLLFFVTVGSSRESF